MISGLGFPFAFLLHPTRVTATSYTQVVLATSDFRFKTRKETANEDKNKYESRCQCPYVLLEQVFVLLEHTGH